MQATPPDRDEIRRYLASTDLFRDLDEATFRSVEQELEWITLGAGEILMRQGEAGDSLFVLLSGRLRVLVERENGIEDPVGEIPPGEAVGEMSIIADERRSATVRTIRPSLLVRLTRTGFERLETSHPEIMKHMARLLVRRLRHVNVAAEHLARPLTIGIVAGARDIELPNFAKLFADALSRIDTTIHLNSAKVDEQFALGTANTRDEVVVGVKLANWLSEQER